MIQTRNKDLQILKIHIHKLLVAYCSLLALCPSGSGNTDEFHDIGHAFNEQTHHGQTDAQGRYLMVSKYRTSDTASLSDITPKRYYIGR